MLRAFPFVDRTRETFLKKAKKGEEETKKREKRSDKRRQRVREESDEDDDDDAKEGWRSVSKKAAIPRVSGGEGGGGDSLGPRWC